jgi:transcriptional regulator with XRE-family HTH domain
MDITAAQCRMARGALQLGVRDVAEMAQTSPNTIARLERGETLQPRTLTAIRTALEAAGVIFIDQNGEGPGVRLKKQPGGEVE